MLEELPKNRVLIRADIPINLRDQINLVANRLELTFAQAVEALLIFGVEEERRDRQNKGE